MILGALLGRRWLALPIRGILYYKRCRVGLQVQNACARHLRVVARLAVSLPPGLHNPLGRTAGPNNVRIQHLHEFFVVKGPPPEGPRQRLALCQISKPASATGVWASCGPTNLDMRFPCFLGRRHSPRLGAVQEFGVFSQAPPQSKSLAGIVALVDQVALGRIGAVVLLEGLGGALPRLGLEAAVLSHAQLHALAQAAEKGGLVGGRPAESRRPAVAIDTAGPLSVLAAEVDVVFRHGGIRSDQSLKPGGSHPYPEHGHGHGISRLAGKHGEAPLSAGPCEAAARRLWGYKSLGVSSRIQHGRAESRVEAPAGSAPARIVTCRIRASGVVGFGSLGVHITLRKRGHVDVPISPGLLASLHRAVDAT